MVKYRKPLIYKVVREGGVEPPRSYPLDPKSSASARFRHSRIVDCKGLSCMWSNHTFLYGNARSAGHELLTFDEKLVKCVKFSLRK